MPAPRIPTYRKHKASGQAVVTVGGRDAYLGPYNSPASRQEYNRVIAEWLAGGQRRHQPADTDLTVVELVTTFLTYAKGYYRHADGTPTSEFDNYRDALRPLRELYGRTTATDFGPLALKAVRNKMVQAGWCRSNVNKQVRRVKAVFKWAASEEMLPASIFHSLQTVTGLKLGRSEARESKPIKPVSESHVEATIQHTSRQVAAMIRLQLLTGMRPGEVCAMRGADIDTSGKPWTYCPTQHKTMHHGHERNIYIGPRGQDLLEPFLRTNLQSFLFAPADAERERREALREARTTPLSCGNRPGSNRKAKPKKAPGERYTVESYNRAIDAACDKAFPLPTHLAKPDSESTRAWWNRLTQAERQEVSKWRTLHRWHPNQLRHAAGTQLRKEFGLEAAQVILGHKTLTVTQVYAEKNVAAAQQVMARVG